MRFLFITHGLVLAAQVFTYCSDVNVVQQFLPSTILVLATLSGEMKHTYTHDFVESISSKRLKPASAASRRYFLEAATMRAMSEALSPVSKVIISYAQVLFEQPRRLGRGISGKLSQ